jgi:hypothetical protein
MRSRNLRLYDPFAPQKIQRVQLTSSELTIVRESFATDTPEKVALKSVTKAQGAICTIFYVAIFALYIVKALLPFLVAFVVEVLVAADPTMEPKRQELGQNFAKLFHTTMPASLDASFNTLLIWILIINVFGLALGLCLKKKLVIKFKDGTTKDFFYRWAFLIPQNRFLSTSRKIIKQNKKPWS